jgi:hypothetical protein
LITVTELKQAYEKKIKKHKRRRERKRDIDIKK